MLERVHYLSSGNSLKHGQDRSSINTATMSATGEERIGESQLVARLGCSSCGRKHTNGIFFSWLGETRDSGIDEGSCTL